MQIGEPINIALVGGAAGVKPPPEPKFRVHLDADRDGDVDDNWRGLGNWNWGRGKRGAIFLCNVDDDDSRGSQDHSDNKINGGNDNTEIAPIVIRKHGAPSAPGSWKGFLKVSAADAKRVRIFDSRSGGGAEIIGPGKGTTYNFPDLAFTEKEFGIEAIYFAGERGARTPPPANHDWDGQVAITFSIEAGGVLIFSQVVRMRVAPWIMMHHLDNPLKVYVVNAGADGVDPSGERIGNSGFRTALVGAVGGVPIVSHSTWDVWMQDCMEIGFTSLPKSHYPVTTRARRDRALKTFPKTLLKPDFGYQELVALPSAAGHRRISTLDSNGNLEVTPPCKAATGKKYPLGRIYYGGNSRPGTGFDADVRKCLEFQRVQAPFSIDTTWLTVAHVDEVVSFVKAPGGQGFKMLLASWRRARIILQAQKRADPSVKMLVGREMPHLDPATFDFLGYHNIEVTVGDFLATGIPALGARGSGLIAFNNGVQAKLDIIAKRFKVAAGVKDRDIIEVPIVYFPSESNGAWADALTGGMVNALVLDTTCVMAKAFGPQTAAGDLFENYVSSKLKAVGVTAKFVDDWYPYHVQLGEVHCGTNTLRDPKVKKWWEVVP